MAARYLFFHKRPTAGPHFLGAFPVIHASCKALFGVPHGCAAVIARTNVFETTHLSTASNLVPSRRSN